jgi:hypothetical protein
MTELPAQLAQVAEAATALHALEDELGAARERLYARLRLAHEAGASYALLARVAGFSRQGIASALRR